MLKKIKERKLHLYILIFLTGMFAGINLTGFSRAEEPAHKYLDYFHQVYQIVKTNYVEIPENKDIFYGAIRGIISSLNDPYSRFLDESAFAALKEETTGKFVGVGIEISVRDGEIIVISPIEDTPAMKAGIQPEDVIVKVDDTDIKDKDLSDIVKLIRGLPHTKVKLEIKRPGFDEILKFAVERVPIKIETVNYGIIDNSDNTGYLKVKVFSADTPRDIEEALKFFAEKGIDKLIVDLRWNPGGLLDKAIKISDYFLEKDLMIVSTKGREGAGNESEFKSLSDPLYRGRLAVLVNKGSASASEIFSGAIKDNKRGILIGEKTFGKGSVQKLFNLDDDIGLTITIAKYYTPSGISIHGKGIVPDYVVPAIEISERDKNRINRIYADRILENFVSDHKEYNSANRKLFQELLKEKDLSISEENAGFIFKKEIYKFSKSPLYDLEYDNQLKEAIRIIKEKPAGKG